MQKKEPLLVPNGSLSEEFFKKKPFFSQCEEHFKNLKNLFHFKEAFVEWKGSMMLKVFHGTRYQNNNKKNVLKYSSH